ncbi:MAG: hypothetical protein EA411_12880 [Saprospirales bacterium]|nr:MAG: hypothetical protein EA411_12880 [Saprospirales bacterium]
MKHILRFLLPLLILSLGFPHLTAQRVTVSEEVSIRSDDRFRIVGQVGDHIVLLIAKHNRIELRSFDRDLRLVQREEKSIIDRHSRVVGHTKLDNSFLVFTQMREGDDQYIIEWEFDERARMIDSTKIAVASHIPGFSGFRFTTSENSTKALFFRSDNAHRLQIFCYDLKNQEISWDRNIEVEGDIRSGFRSILVADDGKMVLAMERTERRFRRDGMHFEFFLFERDSDRFNFQKVSMPDLHAFSQDFTLDLRNNQLVGAGLYYENSSSRAEGHFLMKIDLDNPNEPEFHKNPFSRDLLNNISDQNVNRDGIADVEVTDVMLRNDGGVVIFTEVQKVYERRPTYGQRTFQRSMGRVGWVDYYLEDVIITSFNPDGSELWTNVLYKRQYSQDDDAVFSGFFIMESPSFVRLIFNDEIGSNSTVSEYLVGADGMTERKSVLNTEYQNLRLRFRETYQLNSSAIIVPSESQSNLNLVMVQY